MKNLFLLLIFILSLITTSKAQNNRLPISVSIFNNGSKLPGSGYLGVFSKTIHPGINIGTYHLYRKKEKSELFQTVKLGYFYHRFSQQAVQIYSELGYRYFTKSGFYGEALLGAGYLHSFPDIQEFVFKNGEYVKKKNFGRPQLMISTGLVIGYDFEKKTDFPLRAFLLYQFWLQTPFVNKYVPLLPNTALHLGVVYQFNKKNNN